MNTRDAECPLLTTGVKMIHSKQGVGRAENPESPIRMKPPKLTRSGAVRPTGR